MVWGQIISAAVSLYAANKGRKSASAQSNLALEELMFAREQAGVMNDFRQEAFNRADQGFAREDEIFNYIMSQNKSNNARALDYLNYSRNFVQQDRDFKAQEQDYEKYRITESDKALADERSRQLLKMADDQAISRKERQQALEELKYVQEIASGERDYDVKRYEADRMQTKLEYQYNVKQYEDAVGTANDERQFQINRQEDILRKAGVIQNEIDRTINSLGEIQPFQRYGQDDVNKYADEFYDGFSSDADRAATRIASINEAGLINRGVDQSTSGDMSRMRLLQDQITPLYNTARTKARQEALGYVDGLQKNEIAGFNADVASRAAQIKERLMGNTSMLQVMQGLKNPDSALIDDYLSIGTGVAAPRNLTSAGNYQAPISINSAVINDAISSLGFNDRVLGTGTSRSGTSYANNDGQFTPTFPDFSTGSNLLNAGLGGSGYNSQFQTLASGAGKASSDSTKSLLNGLSSLADLFK